VINTLSNVEYSFIGLGADITINDGGIIITNNDELIIGVGYKSNYYLFLLFIIIL
jgi:hypothetical protein